MTTAFVTTVSASYLPLARVLMDSVAEHHPRSSRYVLLLDGGPDTLDSAEVLRPSDLLPDPTELMVQQYIYKPIEFATALKPKLLLHALESADQVFFLDPDMRLFQPVSAAQEALDAGTGTLLTPHRTTPPAFEDRVLYEWAFKTYGTYNTGFVASTSASVPLLEWWDSRLRRNCLDDLDGSEWVDQKVMDLAPGYFDVDVFKDPGYNVGWWNLEERPLRREGGSWFAGAGPLVLMHYSGVRPRHERGRLPYLVHSPASSVASDPAHLALIQELEDAYIADLMAAGYAEYSTVSYGFSRTPAGRPLSDGDRRGYRQLVMDAEARGEAPPRPDDMPWGRASRVVRSARMLKSPGALARDGREVRRRFGALS